MAYTFQLKAENCKICFEVPHRLGIVVSAVHAVRHLLRRHTSSYLGASLRSIQDFVHVPPGFEKKGGKKKIKKKEVYFSPFICVV